MTIDAAVLRPVFLLGMPRSGTTWLSQIFDLSPKTCVRRSPNFSYRMKNTFAKGMTKERWVELMMEFCSGVG